MRSLITGVDAHGRSCVVEERDAVATPVGEVPGVLTAILYGTPARPPSRPPSPAETIDVQLPAGAVRWMIVEHEPHATRREPTSTTRMHHTDTLDFVYILDGSTRYVLDDGAHEIHAGDCIVTPGVDHAVEVGPDGCRMLVVSIGTPTA